MQLDNLKPAWKQLKFLDAIQHIESKEILSIIENSGNANKTKLQRVVFNLVLFAIITISCQGG